MAEMKNICGKIPIELHTKIREEIEPKGMTIPEFLQMVIEEHFSKKGEISMADRTVALKVTEEFFARLKTVVVWKAERQQKENPAKRRYTQQEFLTEIIEKAIAEVEALMEAERAKAEAEQDEPDEAAEESENGEPETSEEEPQEAAEEPENGETEAGEEEQQEAAEEPENGEFEAQMESDEAEENGNEPELIGEMQETTESEAQENTEETDSETEAETEQTEEEELLADPKEESGEGEEE